MALEPDFAAPDPREIDPRVVRRAFGRAAATYDAAAALQREVGARMAARLDYVKIAPALILDAGCGTGEGVGEFAARYQQARVVALDVALPMVQAARERARVARSLLQRLLSGKLTLLRRRDEASPFFLCGDMNALPLRGVAFDLIWSNLALQWVNDVPRALAEMRRVLKVGGLVSFTTFGPDTLKEIRMAFAQADGFTHTNRFLDMHDIGDMLVRAGFADPVMDMEQLTLTYADASSLMRDLRQLGATNATRGRPRGLMGRGRWRRATAAFEALRRDGRIPATFEVIYGHAWKGAPKRTAEGHPIVNILRPARR
ncbi:MAG: malonyl-ACP O-methyltransferase BioC [Betaproteobacteria bacterium]|nr:malonyl-ACP O-methyltransferase BioC [Betaproteobacteria bacterium]